MNYSAPSEHPKDAWVPTNTQHNEKKRTHYFLLSFSFSLSLSLSLCFSPTVFTFSFSANSQRSNSKSELTENKLSHFVRESQAP